MARSRVLLAMAAAAIGVAASVTPAAAGEDQGGRAPEPPPGVDVTGVTPNESRAVAEAGCPVFLTSTWTMYNNADATQWVDWNVVPGMTGWMAIYMQPAGSSNAYLDSAAGFGEIDVLTSSFDPNPAGYAMRPFSPYRLFATVQIGLEKCTNAIWIMPLPPTYVGTAPMSPTVENNTPFQFVVTQEYLVDVDVPFYYYIPSRQCWPIDWGIPGFDQLCLGGTATAGEDFTAPGTGLTWPGTEFVIPAHQYSQTISGNIIEDNCPEPTESINFHALWHEPAGGFTFNPNDNTFWAFFGTLQATHLIIDDDQGKPPCAISEPPVKE